MKTLKSSVGFVALLVATTCVSAGPLNINAESRQCATRCPESSKFTYTSGKTYEYSYAADVKTSIPDTTEEHSSLHMTATVQIEVLSQCDMVLKLMDVSLQDSNPRDYGRRNHVEKAWEFKRAIQEHSTRFGFLDGHVADLCPNPNELSWVLNIKRAIISALQNTMHSLNANTRVRETDVAGDCEVEYQVMNQGWGVSKVKKIKDVLGCVNGHGHESFFQGVPYKVPSKLQSLPILKTTHECEQEVNSQGLMVKASCMEKHIFRPFSKYHSGAQTEVTYKLEFVRELNEIRSSEMPVLQRSSLVYDFTPSAEEAARGRREAVQTMGELCSMTTEDIRPEVPALFTKLVHQMRLLDSQSLQAVHSSTENMCDKADKFYHDAIPMLGTSASVSMIYDLIKNGKVTGSAADIWMTSLSFIPRPTKEMLPIVMNLMEALVDNKKAALAVSALIHNYCMRTSDCMSEPSVVRVIGMFEKKLRYNCKVSNDGEHEIVMMSLKALGNTGHAESAMPALTRCFRNDEASMDTRIAAVQAMRRMACKADDELFDLYRSESNDAELRIHAYLMLMECPSEYTINRIKRVLGSENISQVGSFVWTHLTNLAETSSPLKQAIRSLLAEQTLKQRFNMDKRKFSRNLEWSLFSELANTGASVESNIIWSEKSYIPRSAMVNLTADLFGHSVNFLEAGARVEGFEHLLESVFGPNGDSNEVPSRSKRSVIKQSALDIIERRFKVKNEEKPSASYYMKIFGNEIRYEDLHGLDLASLKEKLNYLDWLIELAKEHDYDVTKSLVFLDSTMTFPTALGLPLKLHATGTTTVNMKVKGKLDMRKMFKWPSTIDIAGQIKPSAAIEVSGEMGVDAFVTHTGLRMVSTLHTSTITDGRLELKDGKIFKMDINFPQEKMEVFSAESKFYVMHRGEARSQKMITEGRTEKAKCMGGSLVSAFGFEICGEISLPAFKTDTAPWFPMTGPATAKFYVNKKDTLTGVHVEASYVKEKKKVGDQVEITDIAKVNFNTPGSRYDREFLIDFNLKRASRSMTLDVKSPWKKMEIEGSVVDTEELKRFIGKALVDQRNEYGITGEVQIASSKGMKEYTPSLEITIPNKSPMTVGGKLMQKKGKVVVDLSMRNVLKGPVEIRGEVSKFANKIRQKYNADLDFESPDFKVKFDAFHDDNKKGNSISQRCELLWNGPKVKREQFVFSNKIRNQSTKNLMQYSVDSSVESTMWPDFNAQMSTDITKTDKSITGKFEGASGYNHGKTIKVSFGANKSGNLKNAKVAGKKKKVPTATLR